jgi:hypothetical protein
MSSDFGDDFFTPPPFKADEALMQMQRRLRSLRPLSEHGMRYELAGQPVVELQLQGSSLSFKLARRPARSPEWDSFSVKDSADTRRCLNETQKRLARWADDE